MRGRTWATKRAFWPHCSRPRSGPSGSSSSLLESCGYGFALSAPAILQNATGWSVGAVGWMIALFGLLGAGAMLLNGHHSDLSGERAMHCIVPCCVMAAGFLVASCVSQPWLVVTSLAASFIATQALWGPALSMPMEFWPDAPPPPEIAAMNTIAIFSGFFGPYWMGLMKDAWGTYDVGLRGLVISGLGCGWHHVRAGSQPLQARQHLKPPLTSESLSPVMNPRPRTTRRATLASLRRGRIARLVSPVAVA